MLAKLRRIFESESANIYEFLERTISAKSLKGRNCEKSVFRGTRPFIVLGWLNGEFPMSNLFNAKSAFDLAFEKLSFAYIYSCCFLVVKLVLIVLTLIVLHFGFESHDSESIVVKKTDFTVRRAAHVLLYGFGILTHIACIYQTGKLSSPLILLEEYDIRYEKSIKSFCWKTTINSILSFLMSGLPIYTILKLYSGKIPIIPVEALKMEIANPWLVIFLITLGSFLAEFGVWFLFAQIFAMSLGLGDRLESINTAVEGQTQSSGWVTGLNKSWKDLSKQYLDFHTLFTKCEKYMGNYFVILFSMLIMATVAVMYYQIRTVGPDMALYVELICYSYRIYALADCGEMLIRKHRELNATLLRVNQSFRFLDSEKREFNKLLRLTTVLPVGLSAAGFFDIHRRNITAMLGVTVTYVIVLAQFSLAEVANTNYKNSAEEVHP